MCIKRKEEQKKSPKETSFKSTENKFIINRDLKCFLVYLGIYKFIKTFTDVLIPWK